MPGRQTPARIEPYPTPGVFEEDLSEILLEVMFVDHMYFGGWDYDSRVSRNRAAGAFYLWQSGIVRRSCAQHGIGCELA